MAIGDIQRLRQQYVFNPTEDISGGGMGYDPVMDYGDGGGYDEYGGGGSVTDTSQSPYDRPPVSMPAEASSGQAGMGAPPPVAPPKPPSYDPNASINATMDAINRVYTPETVDRDRLRALMDAAPERKAPSFGRAMVAAGLSLKAADPLATSEKVLYAPFYRQQADWKEKADPFYKTAELENRANINERTLAGNVVTGVTAAERLAEQARQADQKNEATVQRNKINMIKANMGQGWKVIAHDTTTVKLWNSATGEYKDTGISTRWMNEEDKVDAEGEWSVKAAQARGEAGVKIAQAGAVAEGKGYVVGPDNRLYEPDPNNPGYVRPVQGMSGGKGPPTRLGPPARVAAPNTLETRRQINDQLKSDYQTSPDAKKFIKRKSDGTYDFADRPVVGPASGWGPWGKDAVTPEQVEQYDQYRSSVDPSYKPPVTKPGGVGGSMGSGKEEPPKAQGVAPSGSTVPWGNIFGGGGDKGDIELTPKAEQHPEGVTVNAELHRSPVGSPQYALEDKAIGMLIQANKRVSDANVAYVIRTRLQKR